MNCRGPQAFPSKKPYWAIANRIVHVSSILLEVQPAHAGFTFTYLTLYIYIYIRFEAFESLWLTRVLWNILFFCWTNLTDVLSVSVLLTVNTELFHWCAEMGVDDRSRKSIGEWHLDKRFTFARRKYTQEMEKKHYSHRNNHLKYCNPVLSHSCLHNVCVCVYCFIINHKSLYHSSAKWMFLNRLNILSESKQMKSIHTVNI